MVKGKVRVGNNDFLSFVVFSGIYGIFSQLPLGGMYLLKRFRLDQVRRLTGRAVKSFFKSVADPQFLSDFEVASNELI